MTSLPYRSPAAAISAAALAVSSSACLVTAPPEYELPPQTAPQLIAAAAYPSIWQLISVDQSKPSLTSLTFGGAVLSEDNGEDVHLALYIDYGTRNAAGDPYKNRVFPFPSIKAGKIVDGPRSFEVQWYLDSVPVLPGCHTIRMVASHEFDPSNVCPVDGGDMSYIEWKLVNCAPGGQGCSMQCNEPTCEGPSCARCPDSAAENAGESADQTSAP